MTQSEEILEKGLINYSTVYDDTPVEICNDKYWPKNSPNVFTNSKNCDIMITPNNLNIIVIDLFFVME